jgi:hypothetical protein
MSQYSKGNAQGKTEMRKSNNLPKFLAIFMVLEKLKLLNAMNPTPSKSWPVAAM